MFGGDRRLHNCRGITIVIDHENLESEDSIKYLGVVIHKNLTWNEHIESLIAKVNQRIGLLNRIKHLLPLDARVALYNALWAGPLEKLCGGRGGEGRGEFLSRWNFYQIRCVNFL